VALARARRLAPADLGAVEALSVAARAEIDALRGGGMFPVHPAPDPDDPGRPVWVGEIDGTVVGYLAASVSGAVGVVDAVYVDAACRAVGVGAALLDAALAWMAAAGCEGVDAYVLPGARQAKNFFEDSALTTRLLVVHRRL
jgi:GNAT superfamily N-acetyltransferase